MRPEPKRAARVFETMVGGQVVLVERTGCPPTLCNKVPDLDYQIDLAPAGDFSVPRGD